MFSSRFSNVIPFTATRVPAFGAGKLRFFTLAECAICDRGHYIIGKLMAWTEGRSRKHETDIYDMLVHHHLELDPEVSHTFNEANIDRQARKMGNDTFHLWEAIQSAARKESGTNRNDGDP